QTWPSPALGPRWWPAIGHDPGDKQARAVCWAASKSRPLATRKKAWLTIPVAMILSEIVGTGPVAGAVVGARPSPPLWLPVARPLRSGLVGCAAVAPRRAALLMPNETRSRKARDDRCPAQPVGSCIVVGRESGDRFPDNAGVRGPIPPGAWARISAWPRVLAWLR